MTAMLRRSFFFLGFFGLAVTAAAETTAPVSIQFSFTSNLWYTAQYEHVTEYHLTPRLCYGNAAGFSFGADGYNALYGWGAISGSIDFRSTANGVDLTLPELLPYGSYVTGRLYMRNYFHWTGPRENCFSGNDVVNDHGVVAYMGGQRYPNDVIDSYTPGDYVTEYVVSFNPRTSTSFDFLFCNNVIDLDFCRYGLVAHIPGTFSASPVPANTPSPLAFAGAGASIVLHGNPAGIITATGAAGAPPVLPTLAGAMPHYWELHSDMAPGSFTGDLTLAYDPAEVPGGVEGESRLRGATYNTDRAEWDILPVTIDAASHKATISGLTHLSVFLLGDFVVGAKRSSWGAVKTLYR
jgi:hypothetical protein